MFPSIILKTIEILKLKLTLLQEGICHCIDIDEKKEYKWNVIEFE